MSEAPIRLTRCALGRSAVTLSLLAVLLLGAPAPRAQEAHRHDAHAAKAGGEAAAQPRIPDVASDAQGQAKFVASLFQIAA